MAVVSFRRPEEGLEYYKNALDVINVIQDIVKNKGADASNAIDGLSKQIAAVQEMSEAKKKEAWQAEEIIAQSKEFLEDFAKQKSDHELYVKSCGLEIEESRKKLQREVESFSDDKKATLKFAEKSRQDAADQLAKVRILSEEAKARHAKAELLEKAAAQKLKEHNDSVVQFEKDKEDALKDLEARETQHAGNIKKLAEDRKAFEARKKRFDDALRE